MYRNQTGNHNIAIGYKSGGAISACGPPGVICRRHLLEAIANKSGSSNVWIGSGAGPVANMEINNSIAIGPDAHTSKSSQVVIGNGQSDEVLFMDGGTCY